MRKIVLVSFFLLCACGITTAYQSERVSAKSFICKDGMLLESSKNQIGDEFEDGVFELRINHLNEKKKTGTVTIMRIANSNATRLSINKVYKINHVTLSVNDIDKDALTQLHHRIILETTKKKYFIMKRQLAKSKNQKFDLIYKEYSIVNMKDSIYSYTTMCHDMEEINRLFGKHLSTYSIGKSRDGRDIMCARIGNPYATKQVVICGSIHGREYINAQLLMKKVEQLCEKSSSELNQTLQGSCLFIIPMVNPDGVSIAQYGPGSIRNNSLRSELLKMKGIKQFKSWKANACGVDINRNFKVGWAKKSRVQKKKPCSGFYPGKSANSEPETKAMIQFMKSLRNPTKMISYHTAGQIIYYDYKVKKKPKKKINYIAGAVHALTGYALIHGTADTKPNGGFGDWCAYVKHIPTITIETGRGSGNPGHAQLTSIYRENKKVIEKVLHI